MLKECKLCFEPTPVGDFILDPEEGEICFLCGEHLQHERDELADNMRKLWKHGDITDEEYDYWERNERIH